MSHGIAFLHSTLKQEDGWRQVLPAGHFRAQDGRPFDAKLKNGWFLDEVIAKRIINQVKAKGKIMVDNEHEYLLAALNAQNGQPLEAVEAAGWIHGNDIKWKEDGLWVKPRWTQKSLNKIDDNDEYGLSATFTYDGNTGEPINFLNVALTGDPALAELKGLTKLTALSRLAALTNLPTDGENSMNEYLLMILAALGLEATEENIAEVSQQAVEKINQLIAKEASADETIADLKAKAVDPLKFVPRSVLEEAQQKIAALSNQSTTSQIDALIEKGRKSGRVMKSEIENLKAVGKQYGLSALSQMINGRAPIAALSDETQIIEAAVNAVERVLTDEEKEAARMLGIDEAEYLKILIEQGAE